MTRNECENKIAEKIIEIAEIYNQYNPQDEYLSMSIQGNYINVNNSCFEQNYNGGKISFILFDYKKDKVVYHYDN